MLFFSMLEFYLAEIGFLCKVRKPSLFKWIKAKENWKWFIGLSKLVFFLYDFVFRNGWMCFQSLGVLVCSGGQNDKAENSGP